MSNFFRFTVDSPLGSELDQESDQGNQYYAPSPLKTTLRFDTKPIHTKIVELSVNQ